MSRAWGIVHMCYIVVVEGDETLVSFWLIYSFSTQTPGSERVCNIRTRLLIHTWTYYITMILLTVITAFLTTIITLFFNSLSDAWKDLRSKNKDPYATSILCRGSQEELLWQTWLTKNESITNSHLLSQKATYWFVIWYWDIQKGLESEF